MEKQKINDSRLTSTMTRVRSGVTQIFTEKNGCTIEIEPPKKSWYAELIDGEWFWLEGCAECLGKPRDWMTYIECDEHNRCRTCGTKRSDIKDAVWGGKHGWQCFECHDAEALETKELALEKFKEEELDEFDFHMLDQIKCPHCGSELYSDETYESEDRTCEICGGEMKIEVEHTRTFTMTVKNQ